MPIVRPESARCRYLTGRCSHLSGSCGPPRLGPPLAPCSHTAGKTPVQNCLPKLLRFAQRDEPGKIAGRTCLLARLVIQVPRLDTHGSPPLLWRCPFQPTTHQLSRSILNSSTLFTHSLTLEQTRSGLVFPSTEHSYLKPKTIFNEDRYF